MSVKHITKPRWKYSQGRSYRRGGTKRVVWGRMFKTNIRHWNEYYRRDWRWRINFWGAYLTYNRGGFTGLQTKLVILNPDCSNGKDIDSQTVFIPAPRGSRQGFAFILAWDIHFGCSTGYGTDHHFGRQYISIASQRWIGTGLLITVKSTLRDKNGSDRWKGTLRIGAAFFS